MKLTNVTCFALITFALCASSEECTANIFYDFMYCLSSNSQCAQCIPCYNNAPLYIPSGKEDTTPASLPCESSAICTECTAKCAANFNGKQYYENHVKNADSSATQCPLLKSFVTEMNHTKISNIDNMTQYEFQCAIHSVISIKYALITSSNHYMNHTEDDTTNCTSDLSHTLKASCDERPFCHMELRPFIPQNCETDNGFTAVIGAFCVSTVRSSSASDIMWAANNHKNSIHLSDGWILTLIVVPWSILCICGIIAPIFCIIRHNGGCSMQCMQCKKISDSERKLNKQRGPISAERVPSDTISPNDGTAGAMQMGNAVHHHSALKTAAIQIPPHSNANKKRRDIQAATSSNPHKYHGQNGHRIASRTMHKTVNNNNMNRNAYHNMMSSPARSPMNSAKARTKSMPTAMYPAAPTTNPHINNVNASSPDAMRVEFQHRKVESTLNARNPVTYHNYNEAYHDPAIPITNERHTRNGSVIMTGGVPLNGSWPNYNASNAMQHPLGALNQSSDVAASSTVLGHSYDNELHQALMYRSNVNINAHNYNAYCSQYYAASPAAVAAVNAPQDYVDYPDLANPNDDEYDDSKIQMLLQNEIQLEAELGRGSSSKVFKARWRNQEVAAKRFTTTFNIDPKKAKQYIEQYASKVSKEAHENVIKILAFGNEPFTILTEYMNKGSVKKYVRRTRPGATSISILDRIEIALQAAKGLQHLHKLEIIHSEINCQNLLMEVLTKHNDEDIQDSNKKEKIRVVVTDYGLQNILSGDELETYRSSLGPLKWMAPECIENSSSPTTYKSDIYAFGITMWEIITGQEPYPDVDPVDTAIHVLVKERRPQSYAFIPEKIQNLMKICWHKHPHKRPDALKIVNVLAQFIETERKQNANRHDLL